MFDKCAKMSPKMLANSLISVYRAKTLGQVWKKILFSCEKFWHSQLNIQGFVVTIQTKVGTFVDANGNVNHTFKKLFNNNYILI